MSTSIINIKTDTKLKKEAQALARRLGISLSAVLNEYLKKFVADRKMTFEDSEEPSEYLIKAIKDSEEDIKNGDVLSFKDHADAIAYLDELITNESN